jgi:predicted glycosyltransferase involved in capsule biosynthesis
MKKVTVIIPTLNSHDIVYRQFIRLQNISKQVGDENLDVAIIDDGSTPPLQQSLAERGIVFEQTDSFEGLIVWKSGNIYILETGNYSDWTQGIAANLGVRFSKSEYVYPTAIDHFVTVENIQEVLKYTGSCLKFPRKYAVLLEDGTVSEDIALITSYGCTDLKVDVAWDIYSMKRDVFLQVGGYDETMYGAYLAIDMDFFTRYDQTKNTVDVAHNSIFVFPEPDKNISIFHNLSR